MKWIKRKLLTRDLDKLENTKDSKERRFILDNIYRKFGTNRKCFRCCTRLVISDLPQYDYLCLQCDENFFYCETTNENYKLVKE